MTFEKWLQSRLTAHGFSVGPIDGDIGPLTIAALGAFQARHKLAVTREADAATVAALRASATALTPHEASTAPDRSEAPGKLPSARDRWPRQSEVRDAFGGVGERQTVIELPYPMFLAWDRSKRVTKMTLHKEVARSALEVFQSVRSLYSDRELSDIGLNIFGGSLNVRKMRGGSSYSMHSWGIAIDFDPERNGLRTAKPEARLSQDDAEPFWLEWERRGWVSLGRERNFDWMHVQAARL